MASDPFHLLKSIDAMSDGTADLNIDNMESLADLDELDEDAGPTTTRSSSKDAPITVNSADTSFKSIVSLSFPGPLMSRNNICTLYKKDNLQFSQKGMLSEDAIHFLMCHLGLLYKDKYVMKEIELLPPSSYLAWRHYVNLGKEIKPPTAYPRLSIDYRVKRAIAFVVVAHSHFTLNILINHTWSSDGEPRIPEWYLLHFDSLSPSPTHVTGAVDYAKHLLESDSDPEIVKVPVLQQKPGSLDCGLYAVHFLRVFLEDIDSCVSHCLKVSKDKGKQKQADARKNVDNVDDFWDEARFPNLRDEAAALFSFYHDFYLATKKNKIEPDYLPATPGKTE